MAVALVGIIASLLTLIIIHYLVVRDLYITIYYKDEELEECAEEIQELKSKLRSNKIGSRVFKTKKQLR
jgi:hypothetical protein